MTEPVADTPPVRRTVWVAVALLAGQALLCGVIGWLNFGPSQAHRSTASPTVPLAVPPFVAPIPSLARPAPTAATTRPSPTGRKVKRKAPAAPTHVPQLPRIVDAPTPIRSARPPRPVAPRESPGLGERPAPPASSDDVQAPVKVGDHCDPKDALGRTADGTSVRCVRDADGDLLWEIA